MSPDQWGSDWNPLIENNWYKVGQSRDGHHNEIEWEIAWKSDPNNESYHGLFGELLTAPIDDDTQYQAWQNDVAWIDFHFNPSTASVDHYKPGNTIGTTSSTWGLSFDSSKTVEISLSQTQTTSDIEVAMIGDTIGIDDEDVSHKYNFSQGSTVAENQTMINAAAISDTNPSSGETFANIDFKSKFENTWYNSHETLYNGYEYGWG